MDDANDNYTEPKKGLCYGALWKNIMISSVLCIVAAAVFWAAVGANAGEYYNSQISILFDVQIFCSHVDSKCFYNN